MFIEKNKLVAPQQYKQNLGRLIQKKRDELKISRRALARLTSLPSHDTIRRLETGNYVQYPDRETLEKLAKHLFNCSLQELESILSSDREESQLSLGGLIMNCERLESLDDLSQVISVCARRIREILDK